MPAPTFILPLRNGKFFVAKARRRPHPFVALVLRLIGRGAR